MSWVRVTTAARKRQRMAWLQAANVAGHRPVVGSEDVVVSLTSYGTRLRSVHLTIESIAAGRVRPRRLILWLDEADLETGLPASLRRLERRGLEIRTCENDRSYRKIYPYALTRPAHRSPCATADDDVLYPRDWLAQLSRAHRAGPEHVHGLRARVVQLRGDALAPYDEWPKCTDTAPGFDRLLTGVSGMIYPARFLDALRDAGPGFRSACPTADDIWLHHVALRNGFRHRQVAADWAEFPTLPGSQAGSLMVTNVTDGGNDVQIGRLYAADDIALMARSAADAR